MARSKGKPSHPDIDHFELKRSVYARFSLRSPTIFIVFPGQQSPNSPSDSQNDVTGPNLRLRSRGSRCLSSLVACIASERSGRALPLQGLLAEMGSSGR
jgi:hypothetical protein